MNLTLFKEGFIVMLIGMGTVFVFLTIMIWAMNICNIILKFIGKFYPEEQPEVKKNGNKNPKKSDDSEIAIAIAAAIEASKKQNAA